MIPLKILESIPYLILFLYGTIIGSFLNVCIYRIAEGQSIVSGPSHCMTCGKRLKWYDMVPVFSWLILGGKCRSCKSPVSPQYPLVEAANGLLYLWIVWVNGWSAQSLVYTLMASALLTLSIIDWRTYEIPVQINLFLAALGILATVLDFPHLVSHLVGAVAISVPLWLLYAITKGNAIGGGDIKLMAACGLIIGWQNIILAFLLACILGSLIHLLRMRLTGAGKTLAMGPYLSVGIFLTALYGQDWIKAYLGLLGL